MLARAFSRDDDGVPAQFEAPFQRGEQAAVAVQLERRFGDEHEIGLTQGESGLRRDESGLAAHELDDADAVGRAHGFHMRAADGFGGLVHGGVETKGLRHEIDVVVDGLGDADDGNADVALAHFLGDGGGGLHGAVAADDEEDAHVEPFERVDDFGRRLRPSGGAEERSAELVNMFDAGRRQLHHVVAVGGDETFEPVTDAQNGRGVVGVVGFKDNGPDHVVEAGAKPAAGDDGAFGFAGIEIQLLTRPRFFKKQGLVCIDVLIVFVAQAQHHLSGIDHVPVRKRRGDFADRDAVFRCHGYSPDGFFSRCWRAKQLVRMPPACATLSESNVRSMGMCRRWWQRLATCGRMPCSSLPRTSRAGVCRRVVKASRLPSPNAAP